MGYKIDPITGEMSEYIFDFGGILALRNFTARTQGERLIIQSATNANFTILDALVSEVEIDGVVYDNAKAAQEALQRLVFNPVVPVIMTLQQQQLLTGAMQKGGYKGTAQELKTYLEGLIGSTDVSGKLDKGTYNGTASDLKIAIDNINRILASDDTDLDQLQEIVNYIKQNKKILSQLSTSNIAGLDDALRSKAEITHTHSYNDLTDKPNIPSGDDYVSKAEIAPLINNFKSDSLNNHGDIKGTTGKYAFHIDDDKNFAIYSGEIGSGDLLGVFRKTGILFPKPFEIPQLHINRPGYAQVHIITEAGKDGHYLDFKNTPDGVYSNLRAGSFEAMKAGAENGFLFKDNMFGGNGDLARIYLKQRSDEDFSLVIEVQNDQGDVIELNTPTPNGLRHNGHKIFDSGNISFRTDATQINLSADYHGMIILCTSNNPTTISLNNFPDLASCSIIKAGQGNIIFTGKTIVGESEINGNKGSSASIIINGNEAIINTNNK